MNATIVQFAVAGAASRVSGLALIALALIGIVSTSAWFEADAEFNRRKADGDPETSKRPDSWLDLTTRFLPRQKKRGYFVFLGVCWAVLIVAAIFGL